MSENADPRDEWEFGADEVDDICPECDSTGEMDGRVCKACHGKGHVQPPSSK